MVAGTAEDPSAVGLGVLDGRWLGVFNMGTVPSRRRRGAGQQVLAALLEWGAQRGARHAYLQVERTNHAAISLYEQIGFTAAYEYAYLTEPNPNAR